MPAIFISYRRDDTVSATGRLADTLAGRFGPDEIFRDIKTIDAGSDFPAALRDALRTAQVVLVVIGRFWATVRGGAVAPRLHEPGDYVRLEIEAALVLQEWPTASRTVDFLMTGPIVMTLAALATSVPLYAGWRLAGARRDYQRVLVILLYQVSLLGLCLSLVTVVMLVGIEIALPGAVDQFARMPTVQAAADLLVALQATAHPVPWLVASMMSTVIMFTAAVWLAIAWRAYRVALGLPRSRSGIALAIFGVLFFGPLGLLIWIASLI
jgi:hypothetical protein